MEQRLLVVSRVEFLVLLHKGWKVDVFLIYNSMFCNCANECVVVDSQHDCGIDNFWQRLQDKLHSVGGTYNDEYITQISLKVQG